MYQTDNCHVCLIGSKPATNKSIRRLCARKKKKSPRHLLVKRKKKKACFLNVLNVFQKSRLCDWKTIKQGGFSVELQSLGSSGEKAGTKTQTVIKKKKKLVNNRQDIFFSWAVRLKDPVFSHKKDWAVKECVYPLVNIDAFFLPTDQKGLVNVWERKRVTDQSTQLHHRCIVL